MRDHDVSDQANGAHTSPRDVVYHFGRYQLDPARDRLMLDGATVPIASRALEILKILLQADGELVDKASLIAAVWPTTFVEEAALRVHVSALRKALGAESGEQYVQNVPGRGYRFGAPIRRVGRSEDSRDASTEHARPNLPAQLIRPVGRDDVVQRLAPALERGRLVTIVGPGGVGKTTVAVTFAHAAVAKFPDGVCYVDLATVSDPDRLSSLVATALGLPVQSSDIMRSLKAQLRDKSVLLVLDCCEPVVDAAARLASELLQANPNLRVLATSREPLRVSGEEVWRLPPLGFPSGGAISAQAAMGFSAVQLFVQRAAGGFEGFELTDEHAAAVGEICRHLDGIPLAIEIAAGHFGALGVEGLRARLQDRLPLELAGSRTASPRHQTLEATIDWSFELLPERERLTFRRLSVFAGDFTPDAARAVLGDEASDIWTAIEPLWALSSKSLLVADISGPTPHYRMLDTTRVYARRRLDEAGETATFRRRHCLWMQDFLRQVTDEWDSGVSVEQLNIYARQIGNLRAATDWAFSPQGDPDLAIKLALLGAPIWLHLSLIVEWSELAEKAVRLLPSVSPLSTEDLAALHLALGTTRHHTMGSSPEVLAAWEEALRLARQVGEARFILPALWAIWANIYNKGRTQEALRIAEEYRSIAESTGLSGDVDMGHDMAASVYRTLGDQPAALKHCIHLLDRKELPGDLLYASRSLFDQRVAALTTLGDVLWVSGRPDKATEVCDLAVERAVRINHLPSLAYTLVFSSAQVAVLCGDELRMARYDTMLSQVADAHEPFTDWVHAIQSLIYIRRGDAEEGVALLKRTLARQDPGWFINVHVYLLTALAEGLCKTGEYAEGLSVLERGLEQTFDKQDFWCLPDAYRIKGDLLLGSGPTHLAAAEEAYLQGLDCAVRQGALSWELRAAIGLAKLRLRQGRKAEAEAMLKTIYGRFTEGFASADLVEARALLARCAADHVAAT